MRRRIIGFAFCIVFASQSFCQDIYLKPFWTQRAPSEIGKISLSKNCTSLLLHCYPGSYSEQIRVWDFASGLFLKEMFNVSHDSWGTGSFIWGPLNSPDNEKFLLTVEKMSYKPDRGFRTTDDYTTYLYSFIDTPSYRFSVPWIFVDYFTVDSKFIVASDTEKLIKWVDVNTGSIEVKGVDDPSKDTLFSPDSSIFVDTTRNGNQVRVALIRRVTGSIDKEIDAIDSLKYYNLTFSPDSKHLMIYSWLDTNYPTINNFFEIRELRDDTSLTIISFQSEYNINFNPNKPIYTYSPDSKHFIIGFEKEDTITVWDLEKRKVVNKLFVSAFREPAGYYFSDCKFVVRTLKNILSWDYPGFLNGKEVLTAPGSTQQIDINTNAAKILSVGHNDPYLTLWELNTGKKIAELPPYDHTRRDMPTMPLVRKAYFMPSGDSVIIIYSDNTIDIWDLRLNSPVKKILPYLSDSLASPYIDHDMTNILYFSNIWLNGLYLKLTIYSTNNETYSSYSIPAPSSSTDDPQTVIFSPDDSVVGVLFHSNDSLFLFSIIDGQLIAKIHCGNMNQFVSFQFSPDGQKVFISSDASSLLWSLKTNTRDWIIANQHGNSQPVFSPDGSQIIFYDGVGFCRFNSTNGELIGHIKSDFPSYVYRLSISTDGKYIACVDGEGALQVFNTPFLAKSGIATSATVNQPTFTVYPNPSASAVKFQVNNGCLLNEISIYDIVGRKRKSFMADMQTSNLEYDISDLPDGSYVTTLTNCLGISSVHVIVCKK